MGEQMPSIVKCSQCPRTFPVRAQMQVKDRSLPMLVVLQEVVSVEVALTQATCQVCLGKAGPPDRGLHEVLKGFGLKDEEDMSTPPREAAVVVHVREECAVHTVGVVVSDARSREVAMVDPLMGTSIQVTRSLTLPARARRPSGSRREQWRPVSNEPRVPRALCEPELREPSPKVEHLTGTIGSSSGNATVLGVAMKAAKERDEVRRLERAQKFGKILFWLTLTLARIRKNAATTEVWDLVETFERKLSEAAKFDAQQRGRKGLLAMLGTSTEEFEAFCLEFYLAKEPLHFVRPVEIVTIDAFEGVRRPESWDEKGGKKPAFYELEVVRIKNSLPVPLPPLPDGGEDPRPRIIYPEGGQFGSDYTVEHSRYLAGVEDKIDNVCVSMASVYRLWLGNWREELRITGSIARFDLSAHIPTFFRDTEGALRILSRSR